MATPGLSIPELFKIIRHSFLESEFDEVQDIVMYRENKMKIEIQDLKRDLDSTKREACLLENSLSLAELEKLRIEEKLQRSESKCGELDEEITRLSDRAKRVSKEFSEKNKLILELNGKIKELQNKNLENEGNYKEESKYWEAEIANLMAEKLASDQLVMDLMRKQYEADKVVAELKLQSLEFTRKLDESRREMMGSDSKFENTAQRVMWMETGLGSKRVKVENLAANEKKTGLPDMIKGCKHSRNADDRNAAIMSDVVCGASKATKSDDTPLVMKGGRNTARPWTEENGAISGRTSGSQSKHNSSGVKINDTAQDNKEKIPVFSGTYAIPMRTPGGSRRSRKMAPLQRSATSEVIEISDSDDEAKPGGTTYIANTSSVKNTRKRRLTELYPSSESD